MAGMWIDGQMGGYMSTCRDLERRWLELPWAHAMHTPCTRHSLLTINNDGPRPDWAMPRLRLPLPTLTLGSLCSLPVNTVAEYHTTL